MPNKYLIDRAKWNRENQYGFFSGYMQPMAGVCAHVSVGNLYQYTKANDLSFFVAYMYIAARSVNAVDELKYRIENENIVGFTTVNISTTIPTENGQFVFCPLTYFNHFSEFKTHAVRQIALAEKGIIFDDRADVLDTLHCSTLPWLDFTMMEHPKRDYITESVPKISFGKRTARGNDYVMPISIHVHHGLADGKHMALFYKNFEELASTPEKTLQ